MKPVAPGRVAQHRYLLMVFVLVCRKHPAKLGSDAERREDARGQPRGIDLCGVSRAGEFVGCALVSA